MDFFQIAFESLPVVASHPFSFIAYLTVLLCWLIIAYKIKRNKQLLLNIDKLPEKDRIKAIELEMGAVKVSSNLTADQWVKSRIHFYYLIGFSIVCFLVLLIFVISIVSSSGIYDDVKEEKQIYYEIILDTSKVMEEEIDGEEKFDIAIDLIGKIKSIVSSDDNLALRVFGGPCGGGNTKLLLRFNKHNVSKIYEEVNRVRLSGNTTIISALTEAISDFNNRQCSANSYKSIIIITGGMDSCFPDYLIEHMKNKIKKLGNDIEINFHIIGITDKKEHVVNLNTIAQLTGGKLWLANSKRNTSRVLNKISEFNLYLSGIREGSSVKISKKK